jgi:SNF2 family DNA or RNA helicase
VNSESLILPQVKKLIGRVINKRKFMLVVDESSDFRTASSKRTRTARALADKAVVRRILDGTPLDNSPLHAYAQFQIVAPDALGFGTKAEFEERYAEYEKAYRGGGKTYPRLVGYKNLPELRDKIASLTSVVLREDCEDLPEVMRLKRYVMPTDEQTRIYNQMLDEWLVELDDGTHIDVIEGGVRLLKLQQVLSGFIIDQEGEVHDVPGKNPRLDALSTEVLLSPGKSIVWCRFREDIKRVAARLEADGLRVVTYYGATTASNKLKAKAAFREDDGPEVWVGHPRSAGRGTDLSKADWMFYYSYDHDNIIRRQSMERATKMHGQRITVTDLVVPDSVDTYILSNLDSKTDIGDDMSRRGLRAVLEGLRL